MKVEWGEREKCAKKAELVVNSPLITRIILGRIKSHLHCRWMSQTGHIRGNAKIRLPALCPVGVTRVQVRGKTRGNWGRTKKVW